MRLLPAFAAAILIAAAGAIAEAPLEIPVVAPLFLVSFAGLCLAARTPSAPFWCAVLLPLALTTLPPGGRWSVMAILGVGVLIEVCRQLRVAERAHVGQGRLTSGLEFFGLALSLHASFGHRAFLPWHLDAATVLRLFVPPMIAAAAAVRIRDRRGFETALFVLIGCAAFGSGLGVGGEAGFAGLLPLTALAAADELARPGREATARIRRIVALAVLSAPILVETRFGILAAAGGLAAAFPGILPRLALPLAIAATALVARLREPQVALPQLAWLLAACPSALLVALASSAALLGVAGLLAAPAGPGAAALSASTVGHVLTALTPAVALALSAPRTPRGVRLQWAWSLAFAAVAIPAAGFPWLAPAPVERIGAWARVAFETGNDLVHGRPAWRSVWASRDSLVPRDVRDDGGDGDNGDNGDNGGDAGRRLLARVVTDHDVHRVAVVSQASNSAEVPFDTAIGILRLTAADGRRVTYPLRTGRETGEWAALRPELRTLPGARAPEAWKTFVAPTASGSEFGQTYRADFDVPTLRGPVVLEVLASGSLGSSPTAGPASRVALEVRGLEWR
jgi:hypothetical protein